jgi:hypothetical protein
LCILGNGVLRDLVKDEKISCPSAEVTPRIVPVISPGRYVIKQPSAIDNFPNGIGKSIFNHFDSVILANLDASYDILTPPEGETNASSYGGSIAGQILLGASVPTCLHIGANNLGFADYIHYRYPLGFIYVNMIPSVTISSPSLQRITVIPADGLSQRITTENPTGVNLILFNGEPTDERILFTLLITSQCLSKGGSLVLRLNASDGRFLTYLEVMSSMFGNLSLFKPCTTDLYDSYIYTICKQRNSLDITQQLKNSYDAYISMGPGHIIESLIAPSSGIIEYVSKAFGEIKQLRQELSNPSNSSGSPISSSVKEVERRAFPPRALIYWGLPGTPE